MTQYIIFINTLYSTNRLISKLYTTDFDYRSVRLKRITSKEAEEMTSEYTTIKASTFGTHAQMIRGYFKARYGTRREEESQGYRSLILIPFSSRPKYWMKIIEEVLQEVNRPNVTY